MAGKGAVCERSPVEPGSRHPDLGLVWNRLEADVWAQMRAPIEPRARTLAPTAMPCFPKPATSAAITPHEERLVARNDDVGAIHVGKGQDFSRSDPARSPILSRAL